MLPGGEDRHAGRGVDDAQDYQERDRGGDRVERCADGEDDAAGKDDHPAAHRVHGPAYERSRGAWW